MCERESMWFIWCDVVPYIIIHTILCFLLFISWCSHMFSFLSLMGPLCAQSHSSVLKRVEAAVTVADETHRGSLVGGSVYFPFSCQQLLRSNQSIEHARGKDSLQYLQACRDVTLQVMISQSLQTGRILPRFKKVNIEVSCCCLCSRCIEWRLVTWCLLLQQQQQHKRSVGIPWQTQVRNLELLVALPYE